MGIGVHQLAILQGSEVAHVERALVRAPAAFLGFEAHKEGHHFRSCKPGFCPAFLFHGCVRAISPSSPRQTGPDHLAKTDLCSHKAIPWRLGPPSDHPAAPNLDRAQIILQIRTWIASGPSLDHLVVPCQTVVDLFRNAKFDPHSNPLAAPNLGSPPRHRPEAIARRPKTKNRLELQLFCD